MLKFFSYRRKGLATGLLFLAFLSSLLSVPWEKSMVHSGGFNTLAEMFMALFKPDLSSSLLKIAVLATWKTLVYAVAGMTLAVLIGLVFGVLASGVLASRRGAKIITKGFFRGLLGFMRAIHELIWAWLFVSALGLSPFAAIFAIALSYGGTLGRIFADMLNDIPAEPIAALEACGATKFQVLIYGYFPLALPNMLSYVFYRFECAIRSSAVMSFIGLGGLGYQIDLSLADLKYGEVWTFIIFLIMLVKLVDSWSRLIRKRLVV